jgi:hypothetical protein
MNNAHNFLCDELSELCPLPVDDLPTGTQETDGLTAWDVFLIEIEAYLRQAKFVLHEYNAGDSVRPEDGLVVCERRKVRKVPAACTMFAGVELHRLPDAPGRWLLTKSLSCHLTVELEFTPGA